MTRAPYGRVETPLGILATWSNGVQGDGTTHVGACTVDEANRYTYGPEPVADHVTVNRVDLLVHSHFTFGADGIVTAMPSSYSGVRRPHWNDGDASKVTQGKALQIISEALTAYVKTPEFREMYVAHVAMHTEDRLAAIARERAELVAGLAKLDDEETVLKDRIASLLKESA